MSYLLADYCPAHLSDSDSDTDGDSEQFIANLIRTPRRQHGSTALNVSCFHAVANHIDAAGDGLDIRELCCREARRTLVAIRRRSKIRKNFDLVTGYDLGDKHDQREFIKYLEKYNASLVTMVPNCRSFGPTSHLNRQIHHDTWQRHYISKTGNTHDSAVTRQ